ncbi:hypothetical protein [Sulfuricurvum sp.]|uniref:hypothetical protein n=1 Tax=Sulfuricurvum sp. TaxID=2025608 RepID=UPI003C4E1294
MMYKGVFVLLLIWIQLHGGECTIRHYGQPPIPERAVELYTAKGGLFSLMLPQGWTKSEEKFPYETPEANVAGVHLKGPLDDAWVAAEISVHYYEHGGFFSDYRDYIRLKRQSFDRQDDNKTSLAEVNAGGKKGVAFSIRTVEATSSAPLFKPGIMYRLNGEMMAKMVPVLESFRVFPAKRGFFVFHYKASESMAAQCHGVFEKTVQSVRFINPEPWQGAK